MDESDLRDELQKIKRRQHLVLVLLVIPYFVVFADLLGYWAYVVYGVFGIVAFAIIALYRRRDRDNKQ